VPILTESGIPVVQLSFGGILVPAKMPAAMVATLEAAREGAGFACDAGAAKMATLKRLKLAAE